MQSQWSSFALLLIFRFLGVAISWEAPLFMGARISQSELDNMAETARRMAKREGPAAMPVVGESDLGDSRIAQPLGVCDGV